MIIRKSGTFKDANFAVSNIVHNFNTITYLTSSPTIIDYAFPTNFNYTS